MNTDKIYRILDRIFMNAPRWLTPKFIQNKRRKMFDEFSKFVVDNGGFRVGNGYVVFDREDAFIIPDKTIAAMKIDDRVNCVTIPIINTNTPDGNEVTIKETMFENLVIRRRGKAWWATEWPQHIETEYVEKILGFDRNDIPVPPPGYKNDFLEFLKRAQEEKVGFVVPEEFANVVLSVVETDEHKNADPA